MLCVGRLSSKRIPCYAGHERTVSFIRPNCRRFEHSGGSVGLFFRLRDDNTEFPLLPIRNRSVGALFVVVFFFASRRDALPLPPAVVNLVRIPQFLVDVFIRRSSSCRRSCLPSPPCLPSRQEEPRPGHCCRMRGSGERRRAAAERIESSLSAVLQPLPNQAERSDPGETTLHRKAAQKTIENTNTRHVERRRKRAREDGTC